MKPTLLILAAGLGSRYGSLKQTDKVGPSGETLMDYTIFDAIRAGFGKVVFVIRQNFENEFLNTYAKKYGEKVTVDYALQEIDQLPEGFFVPEKRKKPWGTGHAVLAAALKIDGPFAVVNADDYYGSESIKKICEFLSRKTNNEYCIVGYALEQTLSDHGSVSRGVCEIDKNNKITALVERCHISKTKNKIHYTEDNSIFIGLSKETLVSMNLMGFQPSFFKFLDESFREYLDNNLQDVNSEFYLPTVVHKLAQNKQATIRLLPSQDKWFGLTYQEDKQLVSEEIEKLIQRNLYPKNLWE